MCIFFLILFCTNLLVCSAFDSLLSTESNHFNFFYSVLDIFP